MKKYLLLLGILSFIVSAEAQTLSEPILLKVQYMARFKRHVEDTSTSEEEKTLEIGRTRSAFYGRWMYHRELLMDSLLSRGAGYGEVLGQISQYPSPKEFYAIYSHYPNKGQLTYTDKILKPFTYTEEMESLQWELAVKDSLILGYVCNKATCSFRGRIWTAYYTPDIPLPSGPWKLSGLPGLILYATDDSGTFSFEAIGIEKGEGQEVRTPRLKKMNKVSRAGLRKLHREKDKDPEKFLERFGASGKGVDAQGRPLVYKPKTTLFMENE